MELRVVKHDLDAYCQRKSWGTRWEVRTKIVTLFFFMFGLVSINTTMLLVMTFVLLFLTALSIGFSWRELLLKLVVLLPFLAFMTLPIIFAEGIPPDQERIQFALNLLFKALSGLIIIMMMMLSQPLHQFFTGLSHLRLPSVFIAIIYLSFHYVFIVMRSMRNMYTGLVSRLFQPSMKKQALQVYGQIAGGMIVRAIDQSEIVYKAMIARGFSGGFPTAKAKMITKRDIGIASIFFLYVVSIHLLEMWWY